MNAASIQQVHGGPGCATVSGTVKGPVSWSCVYACKHTVKFQGLPKGRNQTEESRNAVLAEERKSSTARTFLLRSLAPPPVTEGLVVSPPQQGERETGASSKVGLCTPPGVQADFQGQGREREGRVVAVPRLAQRHRSIFPRSQHGTQGGHGACSRLMPSRGEGLKASSLGPPQLPTPPSRAMQHARQARTRVDALGG